MEWAEHQEMIEIYQRFNVWNIVALSAPSVAAKNAKSLVSELDLFLPGYCRNRVCRN